MPPLEISVSQTPCAETGMSAALAMMKRALRILDEEEAPGEIGAHLDLAICLLGEAIVETKLSQCPLACN